MLKKIGVALGLLPGLARAWMGKPVPLFCQWEVTYNCNMRCVFCPVPEHAKEWVPELGGDEALGIIDQLAELGTRIINFGGGEPFLREDFVDIAKRAKERGMVVFVNSNGSLVEKNIGRIDANVFDFVRISIDGPRELHDRLRGRKGAFDAAMAAIRLLKAKGIGCMINTVVTRDTKRGQVVELLEEARALGVKVSLTPAIKSLPCVENPKRGDLGKGIEDCLVGIRDFAGLLREMQRKYPETVEDPGVYWKVIERGGIDRIGCRVMDTAIGIKPDGRVGFPCGDFTAVAVKGKLRDAYYGDEAKRQRAMQGKYWFCGNCYSRCGVFPTMLLNPGGLLSLALGWSSF